MKKQIIFIHGGRSFKNKESFYKYLETVEINPFKDNINWSSNLSFCLGKKYEIIKPTMPSKHYADYKAWKIWFERHFEFLNDNLILIGHSLGGTFLLKYLSENNFPKNISQLHLVAPAVDEELNTFNFNIKKIKNISQKCKEIYLWHSKDDKVVPLSSSEIIKKEISKAELNVFKNRGHFLQSSFPEIIKKL